MDSSERQKISELIRKSKEGQLNGMMDWMYTREKNNSEDYLLGKKVDKKFEKGDQSPPKEDDVFIERIQANIALDMQAKMREDPLFAIKKREEESKKKILNNPMKMKELQKIIAQQNKARKKKKHKKNSKDDDLIQQYLSILSQKHNKSISGKHSQKKHKHSQTPSESSSSDSETNSKQHSKHTSSKSHRDESSRQHHSTKHRHDSDDEEDEYKSRKHLSGRHQREHDTKDQGGSHKKHEQLHRGHDEHRKSHNEHRTKHESFDRGHHRRDGRSPDNEFHGHHRRDGRSPDNERHARPEPTKETRRQRQNSTSEEDVYTRNYGLIKSKNHRSVSPVDKNSRNTSHKSSGRRSRSRSPIRASYKKPEKHAREPTPPRRKLTAEEKEKRLQEMMDDAKWRDNQRKTNVQRYREEDKKEEDKHRMKGSSASFINPLMAAHASTSSVEERLRRNKYNIQRTNAALDKNFTKH